MEVCQSSSLVHFSTGATRRRHPQIIPHHNLCMSRIYERIHLSCPRSFEITFLFSRDQYPYGIYANIWGILMVNVTTYCIHTDPMGIWWFDSNSSNSIHGSNRCQGSMSGTFTPFLALSFPPRVICTWLRGGIEIYRFQGLGNGQ